MGRFRILFTRRGRSSTFPRMSVATTAVAVALGVVSLMTTPLWAEAAAQAPEAKAEAPNFARGVWPIIEAKCLPCHGGDEKKRKAGLDLRTRAGALKGGDGGPALVPGRPEKSPLYVAVTRADDALVMPPKE